MNKQSQEIEAALFVCSDQPAAAADVIATLDRLDDFALIVQPDQFIRDIHFDAGESILWTKGIALRARQNNDARLITLKGPPVADAAGIVTRLEVESEWNAEGVSRVTAELQKIGMFIPPLPDSLAEADPIEFLQAHGFRIIQARTTHRRVRKVVADSVPTYLAEMDIDAIRYEIGARVIACYEVEIESGATEAQTNIGYCTSRLLSLFGEVLRPWPYGKLLTGKSIAQLLENGELEPALEADGTVGPAACDVIEGYIRLTRQLPAR
jgi:hypothetical protein